MHHSDFVSMVAKIYKPKLYLELGLYQGETWRKVVPHCEQAIGVDVVDRGFSGGEIHIKTTDSFFNTFDRQVDMAFIDADHCFESVLKDFHNVSTRLREGGVIIVHDTDPESDSLFDKGYCGDAYRVVAWLESHEEYNAVTLPVAEAGLTIATKKNSSRTLRRHYVEDKKRK